MDRKETEEAQKVESVERRKFLRSALKFGGVGLLLTCGGRQILASSLTLTQQQLESIQKAQLTPGAPKGATNTAVLESKGPERSAGCSDCSGFCQGCTGGCTGCTSCSNTCQGCTATCASGCNHNCAGGARAARVIALDAQE